MSLTYLEACVKSLCESTWTAIHMPKVVQADTDVTLLGMLVFNIVGVEKVTKNGGLI